MLHRVHQYGRRFRGGRTSRTRPDHAIDVNNNNEPTTAVKSYCLGMIRRRLVVSGDVQGVYFRDTCRRVAIAHRVNGWVRNLPGGDVEATFEGSPDAVAALVEWTKHGPPTALVDAVHVYEEECEGLVGFEIRPSPRRA